ALETEDLVHLSTAAMVALTTRQVAALGTDQVAALTSAQLQAMETADVKALTTAQVAALGTDQLQAFSAAQIRALDTADLRALSSDQVQALTSGQVAALMGAPASTVVFTSGGTEANALAIESAVATGARRLIVSAVEHDAVLETARASGAAVEFWPVDAEGRAELDWLSARLERWDASEGAAFVALMLANNETGVIQPVAEAAEMVRAAGGWLHVDAVQAAGKIGFDSRALGADTLAVSAHKLGGPQGVGALTFGPRARLSRRLHGGGQERGWRAGTENLPGVAGFAAAAAAAV
ncbi:MAG TPA: aminotransferase class V-fold PLP-dependent enzyme, partial [Phenylobacterium sp.]|nr:aminotransferase class V-fold PLP-dependent enzyme [Phenylobacterium sp.]